MATTPQVRELRNFVNGEFKDAREGATLDIVNPSTGATYATAPLSGPADVEGAMRAARQAFEEGWRDTTPSERMACLLKMADAQMTVVDAFKLADDILRQGVQGISDLVTQTGLINLDLSLIHI